LPKLLALMHIASILISLIFLLFVTARKALDQKCSESNGLPKDKNIKLKKRKTF